MDKHTPGPWNVLPMETDKPYLRIRGTQLGCRYKVANVIAAEYDFPDGREVAETCANARLIAAAPELLDALRELQELRHDLPWAWDRFDRAEAAITKATALERSHDGG